MQNRILPSQFTLGIVCFIVVDGPGAACLAAERAAEDVVDMTLERPANELLYRVVVDKKWGFINSRGKIVIEPQFEWSREFSEGLCQVRKDGKWGFIDHMGRWLFEASRTHDDRPFRSGVAVIYTEKGKGIVDRTGCLIECPFDWIADFSENRGAVCIYPADRKLQPLAFGPTGEQWGFINPSGKEVIPTRLTAAGAFSHGLAPVYVGGVSDSCTGLRGGKWGYIDQAGKFVIEPQFSSAASFSEGLATVSVDGKNHGWIDTKGEFVIKPRPFSIATSFHDGVARIRGTTDGVPGWKDFGYITKSGEVFVHPAFNAMTSPFSEGLAEARAQPVWNPVKENWIQGNYGYVGKRGNWVIEPQFSHSSPFQGALACVQKDGAMQYIDRTGRVVWPRP